jgi:hypothetical protein
MKHIFFTLLFLAIVAFAALRVHQYRFESRTGNKFDVMAFELPGTEGNLNALIQAWSEPEKKNFVLQQLRIDYFFMTTLFPAILVLCLWALLGLIRLEKRQGAPNRFDYLKRLLLLLAVLQVVAWAFDLSENIRLSAWINQGFAGNMLLFETLVRLKFIFAIAGILISLLTLIFTKTQTKFPMRSRL